MPRRKLTDATIRNVKPPAKGQRLELFDSLTPGLSLRVTDKGAKSWSLLLRVGPKHARRLRRLTLGDARVITLAQARAQAREALTLAAAGGDPTETTDKSEDHCFAAVAEAWLASHVDANCRARTQREWRRVLAHDAIPAWGTRPIETITKGEVLELLHRVADRGARVQANRLQARLGSLFRWAVERDYVSVSPLGGLRRLTQEQSRDRRLTDQELVWLWKGCEWLNAPQAALTRLLVLTGARRQEVAGMEWSEIDLEAGIWTLPARRSKNGKEHVTHLSATAIEVLRSVPKTSDRWVFSTTARAPVGGFSRAKRDLDKAMEMERRKSLKLPLDAPAGVPPWTLHDLRRTLASACAELGVAVHVCDRILNHSNRALGTVGAVYQVSEFRKERAAALELWSRHVMGLVRPPASNVVKLHI
jgi:integrase